MKIFILIMLMVMSLSAHAGTAFYKHEYISGMNKICVYDHLGSDVALTIKSYKNCPMTIQV